MTTKLTDYYLIKINKQINEHVLKKQFGNKKSVYFNKTVKYFNECHTK